jgi:hypothetical protein
MRALRLLVAAAFVALAGCATQPPRGQGNLLEFLRDGETSRTDVYLKLGTPSRTYETNRIASWRLDKDEAGYFLVSSSSGWRGTRYELVVVFGTDDVVKRHSLVEIRSP